MLGFWIFDHSHCNDRFGHVIIGYVVFGVGWGTPFVCFALMGMVTAIFVKWSLRCEHRAWSGKTQSEGLSLTP